ISVVEYFRRNGTKEQTSVFSEAVRRHHDQANVVLLRKGSDLRGGFTMHYHSGNLSFLNIFQVGGNLLLSCLQQCRHIEHDWTCRLATSIPGGRDVGDVQDGDLCVKLPCCRN